MLKPSLETLMSEGGRSGGEVKPARISTTMGWVIGLAWLGMVSFYLISLGAGILTRLWQIPSALCAVALWLILGVMLLDMAFDRGFALWTRLAAPAVLGLSLLGAYRAMELSDNDGHWWMALVAVLPFLAALYVFRRHLWIAAAMALLCVPPMVLTPTDKVSKSERGERIAGAVRVRATRDRAEYKASPQQIEAFSRFGPDSRMDAYLPYYFWGDLAGRAREGIRAVKSRQTDTVRLLNQPGGMTSLVRLWDFDVAATSEVCRAYAAALDKQTRYIDSRRRAYYSSGDEVVDLERQLPNLRWLVDKGCDLKAPLGRLENTLRSIADIPFVTNFADEVAALRTK
jgi:hypothetical protein